MFDNLLVEKYRPKRIVEYCLKLGNPIEELINSSAGKGSIPNVLLVGSPGIGKTTLAKIFVNELMECDHLYINASDENGIDTIRSKVTNYAKTKSLFPLKVIILDECDGLTQDGQRALRNVMEEYSAITRFILTANYKHRIIPALQSRCQTFSITHDHESILRRIKEICAEEKITASDEDLDKIVKDNFPDIRKTINTIQKLNTDGVIKLDDSSNVSKLIGDLYKLISHGHVLKCRKLAIKNEHTFNNDYPVLLKEMFNYIDELDINEEKKKSQLVTCHDFIYKSSFVMDQEINAYSCFITLSRC